MAKIKFDVSGSDPEAASQSYEQPQPGVYNAVVHKLAVTKPDGKDRRIEVQYKITDRKYNGAVLFDYVNLESEASQWKLDQFLQTFGVATKSKRKGTFDTDLLQGKSLKVRVKGDTYGGEYRAKVGSTWAVGDEDEGVEEVDEDEVEVDDEVEDDEEATVDYSEWDLSDLKDEAKSRKIPTKGLKKSQIIAALEENDAESEDPFDE